MALQCHTFFYNSDTITTVTTATTRTQPLSSQFPSSFPISQLPLTSSTSKSKLHQPRLSGTASAVISGKNAVMSSLSGSTCSFKLTYLEGNSWLWDVNGLKILVDPILVGNLDFGVPWLYDAAKKFLKNYQLSDLPELDCLLITQSLDDHCHKKTLKPLSEMFPDLPVVSTPNAEAILNSMFNRVTYLEPGQCSEIEGKDGSKVSVRATAGPILGPPWQRPENGYVIVSRQSQLTLYYEPHCVYDKDFLQNEKADIIITPVIKQLLPAFTLVSGQEDAVQLAKTLRAKFIVPMKNGELDANGLLKSILYDEGTIESFRVRFSWPRDLSRGIGVKKKDLVFLGPVPCGTLSKLSELKAMM